MSYDYVRRAYGVDPRVGQTVTHQVTKQTGRVAREDRSCSHYVMVRFGDDRHALPCHPKELDYAEERR